MDIADIAQEINETFLENTLRKHRRKDQPFSGFCLSCKEPVGERRFCDSHCREEFESNLRKQRNGFCTQFI